MAETTTEEQKEFTVTLQDGTQSTVVGKVTTTDHGVTDAEGNPKISVNIAVPSALIGVLPGENG